MAPNNLNRHRNFVLIVWLSVTLDISRGMSVYNRFNIGRRSLLAVTGASLSPSFYKPTIVNALGIETNLNNLSSRFNTDVLYQPKVKQMSELNLFTGSNGLYDDLFFPSYMLGEWDVYQTLSNFQAPLGKKFLSGPSGLRDDVADATIAQQLNLIGKRVGPFTLRFIMIDKKSKKILSDEPQDSSLFYVVEDRLSNLRSRANAFAGKDVVKTIEYVEVGGANSRNYGEAPLPTTLLRYRGPGIQKTFSNNRDSEIVTIDGSEIWTGFESTRTIFARKDIDLPPIVSDTEVITSLSRPVVTLDLDSKNEVITVHGKLRIAGYLNPNDALFFDAKQRAVSISDYDIELFKRRS